MTTRDLTQLGNAIELLPAVAKALQSTDWPAPFELRLTDSVTCLFIDPDMGWSILRNGVQVDDSRLRGFPRGRSKQPCRASCAALTWKSEMITMPRAPSMRRATAVLLVGAAALTFAASASSQTQGPLGPQSIIPGTGRLTPVEDMPPWAPGHNNRPHAVHCGWFAGQLGTPVQFVTRRVSGPNSQLWWAVGFEQMQTVPMSITGTADFAVAVDPLFVAPGITSTDPLGSDELWLLMPIDPAFAGLSFTVTAMTWFQTSWPDPWGTPGATIRDLLWFNSTVRVTTYQ